MSDVAPEFQPGIYFNLPESVYRSIRALSYSGIKHLAVSPLRYWHNCINTDKAQEADTRAKRFGKATHCLALEPARFAQDYGVELAIEDYPHALVTTEHMKSFLEKHNLPKTAKRKQELIDRIEASGHNALIWDRMLE